VKRAGSTVAFGRTFEYSSRCTIFPSAYVSRDICVGRGTLDGVRLHAREVFRAAIEASAAAVILVHNHPSGDPTPSPEDRVFTNQMAATGRTIDIPVHDHIIIGHGRYVSFVQEQWL
jgi:DNA repair protein RadC